MLSVLCRCAHLEAKKMLISFALHAHTHTHLQTLNIYFLKDKYSHLLSCEHIFTGIKKYQTPEKISRLKDLKTLPSLCSEVLFFCYTLLYFIHLTVTNLFLLRTRIKHTLAHTTALMVFRKVSNINVSSVHYFYAS